MRGAGITKANRFAAGLMALTLLLVIVLSALFLVCEADHDCTGEDCPICACIQQCGSALRRFGASAAALPAAVPVIPLLFAAAFPVFALAPETPVSRRSRLNN